MLITYSYKTGMLMVQFPVPQGFAAASNVRNELNKERPLHDPEEVIFAMTGNPYDHFAVMPRPFPLGMWTVGQPEYNPSNKFLQPVFIPTDARRELPVWDLDEAGGYDHITYRMVRDTGYGLHWDEFSITTVGCLRADTKEHILWLAAEITGAHSREELVRLQVTE